MSLYALRRAIVNADTFILRGDNFQNPGNCIACSLSMRENQQQTSGNFTWNLECWRPLQCIMKDQTISFDLIPDDTRR